MYLSSSSVSAIHKHLSVHEVALSISGRKNTQITKKEYDYVKHLYIFSRALIHSKLNSTDRAVPSIQAKLGDPVFTESYGDVVDNTVLLGKWIH